MAIKFKSGSFFDRLKTNLGNTAGRVSTSVREDFSNANNRIKTWNANNMARVTREEEERRKKVESLKLWASKDQRKARREKLAPLKVWDVLPTSMKASVMPSAETLGIPKFGRVLRGAVSFTPWQARPQILSVKSPITFSKEQERRENLYAPTTDKEKGLERLGRNITGTLATAGQGGPNALINVLRRVPQGILLNTALGQGRRKWAGEDTTLQDVKNDALQGIETSWQLALTNLATDKIVTSKLLKSVPFLKKWFGGLTDDVARGALKEIAKSPLKMKATMTAAKLLFMRALAEVPLENTLFTATGMMNQDDKESYFKRWWQNLPVEIVANVAYAGVQTGLGVPYQWNKDVIDGALQSVVKSFKGMPVVKKVEEGINNTVKNLNKIPGKIKTGIEQNKLFEESPIQAVGLLYGFEKDEEGNWTFNPMKAGMGLVAGQVAGKDGVKRLIKDIKLPTGLAGAKPRFGYGSKGLFEINFKSDIDKALYIVSGKTRSKSDEKYMDFLRKSLPGLDDGGIRDMGAKVKLTIKGMIANDVGISGKTVSLPAINTKAVDVPKQQPDKVVEQNKAMQDSTESPELPSLKEALEKPAAKQENLFPTKIPTAEAGIKISELKQEQNKIGLSIKEIDRTLKNYNYYKTEAQKLAETGESQKAELLSQRKLLAEKRKLAGESDKIGLKIKGIQDKGLPLTRPSSPTTEASGVVKTVIDGKEVAENAKDIGSDQGGLSDFTLDQIGKEDYKTEIIKIGELKKLDPDLVEYLQTPEIREFEGEPFASPPVVSSKGEVIDGYNRIAQAIKNGETEIKILRGVEPSKPITAPSKVQEVKPGDDGKTDIISAIEVLASKAKTKDKGLIKMATDTVDNLNQDAKTQKKAIEQVNKAGYPEIARLLEYLESGNTRVRFSEERLGEINKGIVTKPITTPSKPITALPKPTKTTKPLEQEAKKYKSVEEFVANKQKLYRGSSGKVNTPNDIFTHNGTIYLSSDKKFASEFGKNINEYYVDLKNPYNFDETGGVYKDMRGDNVKGIDGKVVEIGFLEANPDIVKDLKLRGYDGAVENGGEFTVAFDKSQIKTKSQLTDIWNKAQGKAELEPLSQLKTFEDVEDYLLKKYPNGIDLYHQTSKNIEAKIKKDGFVGNGDGDVYFSAVSPEAGRANSGGEDGMVKITIKPEDYIMLGADRGSYEGNSDEKQIVNMIKQGFDKADVVLEETVANKYINQIKTETIPTTKAEQLAFEEAQMRVATAEAGGDLRDSLGEAAIKDINTIKKVANSKAFKEGDIETLRSGKYKKLVNRVIESVQEVKSGLDDDEALRAALDLPTKAASTVKKKDVNLINLKQPVNGAEKVVPTVKAETTETLVTEMKSLIDIQYSKKLEDNWIKDDIMRKKSNIVDKLAKENGFELNYNESFQTYELSLKDANINIKEGQKKMVGLIESFGMKVDTNTDGTVRLIHETSKENADLIMKNGLIEDEGDLFFSPQEGALNDPTEYGDTRLLVDVDPRHLFIRTEGELRVEVEGKVKVVGVVGEKPVTTKVATETPAKSKYDETIPAPGDADMKGGVEGSTKTLPKEEYRVWVHGDGSKDDTFKTFDNLDDAKTFIKNTPGAEEVPLKIEGNKEIPMWETKEGFTEEAKLNIKSAGDRTGADGAGPPPEKIDIEKIDLTDTKNVDKVFENIGKTWTWARRAANVIRIKVQRRFASLDAGGLDTIFKFQEGDTSDPKFDEARAMHETLRQNEIAAGIDVKKKAGYLYQLWDLDDPKEQAKFDRYITLNPRFATASTFDSYKEGIAARFVPKFKTLSNILALRASISERAIADKQFFDKLTDLGIFRSKSLAPSSWKGIDPDKLGGKSALYAPPEIAGKVNEYLNPGLDGWKHDPLKKIADINSLSKSLFLTGGVPGTAINFYGWKTLINHMKSTPLKEGGFIRGLFDAKYFLKPELAARKLDLDRLSVAVKTGLNASAEDRTLVSQIKEEMAKQKGLPRVGKEYKELLAKTFENPLFQKVIPYLKLQRWEQITKDLMKTGKYSEVDAQKIAAEQTNNLFGGMDTSAIVRSKNSQNLLRALFLASDLYEANIKQVKGMAKGIVNPLDPEFKAYRTIIGNVLLMYVVDNVINKATSGHWMFQNEENRKFHIEGGYTKDGERRYFPGMTSLVDWVTVSARTIGGLLTGNLPKVLQVIRNRLAPAGSLGLGVVTNRDWLNRKIADEEDPMWKQVVAHGGQAFGLVTPTFVSTGIKDLASGRKPGLEQLIARSMEIPLRYSGSQYKKTGIKNKDALMGIGYGGEELYNKLNKEEPQYKKKDGGFDFWGLFKKDDGVGVDTAGMDPIAKALAEDEELSDKNKRIKEIFGLGLSKPEIEAALKEEGFDSYDDASVTILRGLGVENRVRGKTIWSMLEETEDDAGWLETVNFLAKERALTTEVTKWWVVDGIITEAEKKIMDKLIGKAKGTGSSGDKMRKISLDLPTLSASDTQIKLPSLGDLKIQAPSKLSLGIKTPTQPSMKTTGSYTPQEVTPDSIKYDRLPTRLSGLR